MSETRESYHSLKIALYAETWDGSSIGQSPQLITGFVLVQTRPVLPMSKVDPNPFLSEEDILSPMDALLEVIRRSDEPGSFPGKGLTSEEAEYLKGFVDGWIFGTYKVTLGGPLGKIPVVGVGR